MLTGKYWITPHGVVDVSASEHALYAKNFMLRLLGTNYEIPLTKDLFAPMSAADAASHANRGIPKKVLKFLQTSDSDGLTDARIYAIRELGWIRIRRSEFYVWRLNDETLLKISRAKKYSVSFIIQTVTKAV